MFVKLTVKSGEERQEMWFNPARISRIVPQEEGSIICVHEGGGEPNEYHVKEGALDIDNRSYRAAQGRFSHQQLEGRGSEEGGRTI